MVRTIRPTRTEAWLLPLLLVAVSAVSSLAFACVTPFVAFTVVAVYALPLRTALLAVIGVWLANQVVGFAFLSYPLDLDTALWGLAIGAAAMLATMLAHMMLRLASGNVFVALVTAFVVAFAAYEAGLFLVTFALGGRGAFTPAIVGQFALLNIGWAIALVATTEMLRRAGTMRPHRAAAGVPTRTAL
jgi:hypothetical protein